MALENEDTVGARDDNVAHMMGTYEDIAQLHDKSEVRERGRRIEQKESDGYGSILGQGGDSEEEEASDADELVKSLRMRDISRRRPSRRRSVSRSDTDEFWTAWTAD